VDLDQTRSGDACHHEGPHRRPALAAAGGVAPAARLRETRTLGSIGDCSAATEKPISAVDFVNSRST